MPSLRRPTPLILGEASLPSLASASVARPKRSSARLSTRKTKRSKAGRQPAEGICANCGCNEKETGQWREDRSGVVSREPRRMCSACGLYYTQHGIDRPREKWSRRRRSSASSSSPRTSGDSTTSLNPASSSSATSSQFLTTPYFVHSPTFYDESPLSPLPYSPGYSTYDERLDPKYGLTLGAAAGDEILFPQGEKAPSEVSGEFDIVLLGQGERGETMAVGPEQLRGGACEEEAAAALLLSLGQRSEVQAYPQPLTTTFPPPVERLARPLPPRFSLLDTRPSFLYNRPPQQATLVLPWPVPRLIPSASHPSERLELAPMRRPSHPTLRLPALSDLGFARSA